MNKKDAMIMNLARASGILLRVRCDLDGLEDTADMICAFNRCRRQALVDLSSQIYAVAKWNGSGMFLPRSIKKLTMQNLDFIEDNIDRDREWIGYDLDSMGIKTDGEAIAEVKKLIKEIFALVGA